MNYRSRRAMTCNDVFPEDYGFQYMLAHACCALVQGLRYSFVGALCIITLRLLPCSSREQAFARDNGDEASRGFQNKLKTAMASENDAREHQ